MTGEGQPQHFPIIDRERGALDALPDRPATVDYASRPVLSMRYALPQRRYRNVSEFRRVQEWDGDWTL